MNVDTSVTMTTSFDERAHQYGVKLARPTAEQVEKYWEMVDTICDSSRCMQMPQVPDRVTIMHRKFVASPLTQAQSAAVLSGESSWTAALTLELQTAVRRVRIEESFEPLVNLVEVFKGDSLDAVFSDAPFHSACGPWAGKPRQFWVRERVADRVMALSRVLDELGILLRVEDAFRPVGVQEGLFQRRVQWSRDMFPTWSPERVLEEARSKTASTPRLASHKGGAALDITLLSRDSATPLSFGHQYPDGGALVASFCPFVTFDQWCNREALRLAATSVGMTMYIGEDWHASFGDNLAGVSSSGTLVPGYVAVYGPIKDFDSRSGAVLDVYSPAELDHTFDTGRSNK